MPLSYAAVADAIQWAQKRQALHYNKRRRAFSVEVGESVLVHRRAFGTMVLYDKTLPLWFGPYPAKEINIKGNPNLVLVDMHSDQIRRVVNIGWLRKYHPRDTILQPPLEFNASKTECKKRANDVLTLVGEGRNGRKTTYFGILKNSNPVTPTEIPEYVWQFMNNKKKETPLKE